MYQIFQTSPQGFLPASPLYSSVLFLMDHSHNQTSMLNFSMFHFNYHLILLFPKNVWFYFSPFHKMAPVMVSDVICIAESNGLLSVFV